MGGRPATTIGDAKPGEQKPSRVNMTIRQK